MKCGALVAQDCATGHWCRAVANARREPAEWRGDCPVDGTPRALWWKLYGRGISWGSYCPNHPKEALRPVLDDLLPECLAAKRDRVIRPADIRALALAEMPAKSRQLAMLELAGIPTSEALAMLGIRREHHSRTIAGRNQARTSSGANTEKKPAPVLVHPPRTNFGAAPQVTERIESP